MRLARLALGPTALITVVLLTGCAGEPAPVSAPLAAEAETQPDEQVRAETEEFGEQPPTDIYPGAWASDQERALLDYWNVSSWEEAAVGIGWAGLVTDVRANEVGELIFVFEGSNVDQGVEQAADHAVQEVMYSLGPLDESLTSVAVMDTLQGDLFEWCTRSVLTQ